MTSRPPLALESESDLERLFGLAHDALMIVGFDGYFKRVNPALERMLGYSNRELLSRPFLAFYHPDDLQEARELFANLLDKKGEEVIGSENRVICADGTVRWLEWNTRIMPHEGLMYCVARDVTDRRRAEAELREAKQVVEASHDELRQLADEQAALRRVATLVAKGVSPTELFAAVSDEVGRVVGTDSATVIRYDDDGEGICYVGSASKVSGAFPVGVHWKFQEGMASFEVYRTGRSARSGAHLITVDGPIGDTHRRMGIISAVASPIHVEGRLWGAMAVHGQQPLPPDTEQRVEKFTKLVASAIANAESRGVLTRLADEQAALRRVATLVARGVQADEIFAAVSDEVGRLFGTESATVVKYDDEGAGIVFVGVASRVTSAFPLGAHWLFQEGMASAEVYRTGHSARTGTQLLKAEGPIGDIQRGLGITSSVASPIIVEGRLWGAMSVQSQEPLPADTEQRVEKFTELVATAIANAEGRAAVDRLAEEQEALRRMATLVARGVRADEVFAAVSDVVGRLVGTDSATVMKFDDEGSGIVFVGSASKMSGAFPVGAHWKFQPGMASAEVYRTGRPARSDDPDWSRAVGPVGETHRQLRIVSAVASPILVEGRLWGAMAVQSQEPLPLGTEERLEKFTELVATAIANAESRAGLARLAEEQAALRRVATLVAEGLRPGELFSAVSEEVASLFGSGAGVVRYDHDGPALIFVGVARAAIPIGTRWDFEEGMATAKVFETRRSARVESVDWTAAEGPVGATARAIGVVSSVASPVVVEGRLWGAMTLWSPDEPLPSGSEERLEQFSELLATAIVNAEYRDELAASRRRIVAASDETRRRIERDLHDGIQQRLVSIGLELRLAESSVPTELAETRTTIARVARELNLSLEELQEISRGIHPVILAEGGLRSALRTLARRSAVPVDLRSEIEQRLPEPIEVAAYYIASEALTNATKHAKASHVDINASTKDGSLRLSIRDDGIGGADPGGGTGLVGLTDRVEALGGSISVSSPPGDGTHIAVELPLELTQT